MLCSDKLLPPTKTTLTLLGPDGFAAGKNEGNDKSNSVRLPFFLSPPHFLSQKSNLGSACFFPPPSLFSGRRNPSTSLFFFFFFCSNISSPPPFADHPNPRLGEANFRPRRSPPFSPPPPPPPPPQTAEGGLGWEERPAFFRRLLLVQGNREVEVEGKERGIEGGAAPLPSSSHPSLPTPSQTRHTYSSLGKETKDFQKTFPK